MSQIPPSLDEEDQIFKAVYKVLDSQGLRPHNREVRKSLLNRLRYYLPRIVIVEHSFEAFFLRWLYLAIHWSQTPWRHLPKLVYLLTTSLVHSVSLLNFYMRPERFRHLLESLENINRKYSGDARHRLLVDRTRKLTDSMMKGTQLGHFVMIVPPGVLAFVYLTRSDKILSVGYYFPYDVLSTPYNELTALVAVFCWTSALTLFGIPQYVLFAIMFHVITQFRILRDKLLNIRADSLEHIMAKRRQKTENCRTQWFNQGSSLETSTEWKVIGDCRFPIRSKDDEQRQYKLDLEMHKRMIECIKQHQELLECVNEFGSYLQPNLMSGIAFILVSASISVVNLTVAPLNDLMTWVLLSAFFSAVGLVSFYAFLFDLLTEESEAVREAAYGGDWFEASTSFKRSILIMMSMANRPVCIEVASFLPINLKTLQFLIRVSFDYYTVIAPTVSHNA